MKALKIVGIVLGAVLLLIGVAVALALTPSIQTWAVRKALADQPGVTFRVAKVSAGFSAADISDLHYAKDGIVVTAKGISARYSAWDYLTNNRVNADSVTVQDLVVDLRQADSAASARAGTPASPAPRTPTPGAAPAPTKSPSFEGALKEAQLPVDVRVAALAAKGRALLPDEQTVVFDLSGSGIETGQRGKLGWTIEFADAKSAAPLQRLRATGTAFIQITKERRIDALEVETTAAVSGPQLPSEQIKLFAKAEQAAGGNENYSASVGLLRGSTVQPLLKTDAQFLSASREIAGAWQIDVRTEQLAAVLAGLGLPEVALSGTGKFNLKPETNAVAASGNLQGRASQLQKLSPALESIGAVQFTATFGGAQADNVARLDTLNMEVTGADGRRFAQISTLQPVTYGLADKRVGLANPRNEVARVALQQLPLAWAQAALNPMVIESGDLSLVLAVEAEPDGSRIRARALEPLAIRTVSIRDGDKRLVDRVTLTARPTVDYTATRVVAQLAALEVSMPSGDGLTGSLTADVTNLATVPVVAFGAQLQAKIVAALKPYLPVDTGPLALAANLEGRHEGERLDLAKASVTVNRENGNLLSAVELVQPIRLDTKTSSFAVSNPAATAARVRLGEIPLAWAEAFVANSKLEGAVSGATLEVSLRSLDDVSLTTAEPVVLRGVSATLEGKPLARTLDVAATFSATKRGDTVVYDVRRIDLKQGDTALAGLTVAGEANVGAKFTLVAKGNLEADIPALMRQPAAAEYATLAQGRLTAAFDANLTDTIQAKATISAKNLVAKHDNRALGDLELTLNAAMKSDGSGTVSLPLTLASAARKSDLVIEGAFGKAANRDTYLFTGKIASNQLFVEDFQPLAGLAPGAATPPPTATPAPRPGTPTPNSGTPRSPTPPPSQRPSTPAVASAPKPTRDSAPVWQGVNGKLELDLKQVTYGKDYPISGVRGALAVTDSRVSLDGLEGRFKNEPFKLAGGLTFSAQQPKPYALQASADIRGVDVGEILRGLNPSQPPEIETKVSLVASVKGSGGTLGEVFEQAYGQFDVTGTQGILRGLGQKGETVGTVSALGGLIGAATGSNTTAALATLARELAEYRFERFEMRAERQPDLSFKLTSIEFISPSLRLTGTGSMAHQPGVSPLLQPIQVEMKLAGKEHMAQLLNQIKALAGTTDDKGYYPMRVSFKVRGSVTQFQTDLWKVLGSTAAQIGIDSALPALEGLLRRR